jgi:hypothetical protein
VFTNQRNELLGRNKKCHDINKTEHPQNDEPGEPIRIAAMEKDSEEFLVCHCKDARSPRRPNAQRSTSNAQHRLLKTDAFEDRDEARIVPKRIPSRIDL